MRTRRANSQEMTYDQVQDRKDRGVEGLRRLGNDSAAAALQGETVEDFAERKGIVLVNPRRKSHRTKKNYVPDRGDWARTPHGTTGKVLEVQGGPGRRTPRRYRLDVPGMGPVWVKGPLYPATKPNGRRNPNTQADAESMYEKFHGKKPTSIREISQRQGDVHNLSGLGTLLFLRTDVSQELFGKDYAFCFSEQDRIIAACDPDGEQIYFVGGKQDLTKMLTDAGVDVSKDLLDLGECDYICYLAQKDFDHFQPIEYQHRFGEESGVLPRLMFSRLEKQIYLIGGEYQVKREGIVN